MSINPFGDAAEQLVARFYAWEQRGRGWQVHPHPVELEPAFQPFERFVRIPASVDDGRRPGALLSALTLGLAGRRRAEVVEEGREEEPVPAPVTPSPISELHLLLPESFDPQKHAAGPLLEVGRATQRPAGIELIGHAGTVSMQVACAAVDAAMLTRRLDSLAAEVAVLPRDGFLADIWQATPGPFLIADLGLSEEFMRPLASGRTLPAEPLVHMLSALGEAGAGEVSVVQMLFSPTRRRWAENILASLTDADDAPFFLGSRELLAQAKRKVSAPLFACRLRLAAKSARRSRSVELLRALLSSMQQFNQPAGNSLIALDHAGMPAEMQETDLLRRSNHRSGMLLNADELAGLVHFPGLETLSTPLERLRQRTKAAPEDAVGHELVLGDNSHRGQQQPVTLSLPQRSRHVYAIGGSGTGKSTLLLNLITQDVAAGQGVAVLDPHGDLVDAVLSRIPVERTDDVVLIDPSDEKHPVGINVLAAHSELERTLLSSDLVAAFRRQSTSWGDQMNAVFSNAVHALLESSQGGTLLELRRFLVEKDYRTAFLRTVANEEVRYYWEREYPLLRGNAQAPILTRLDAFLRPRLVRNVVANPGASLDFRRLVDERKIVLVKLAQGGIGEENAHLLGSLVLTKLQQVALSRQDTDAADRSPFFVYLDEFHHFSGPSTATLLSGVRKYGLSLTLAHQNLTQVPGELVDSVLANAGTRICFRLGDADARKLSDGFSFFEARDLQNLDVGQAICRIGRSEADFNLATRAVAEVAPDHAQLRVDEVIAASRRQWSTPIPEYPAQQAVPVFAIVGLTPEEPVESVAPVVSGPLVAVPPSSAPVSPARPRPAVPVTPGRGGQQHKYLQTLVKRFGEDRGFKATIEMPVLDGHGSVDVALEREDMRVAVEISVSTLTEHELKNLAKCLAAGFDAVVLVSTDEKGRKKMRTAVGKALDEAQATRAHCLLADEIPAFLDELVRPEESTQTVAGYTVKVQVRAPGAGGDQGQRKALKEIIARSLGRGPGR